MNGQKDKHVQKWRDGSKTCSQTIHFVRPRKNSKIIYITIQTQQMHTISLKLKQYYKTPNPRRFRANNLVRKHVEIGVL